MSLIDQTEAKLIQLIRLTGLREQELIEAQKNNELSSGPIGRSIQEHNRLISMSEKHSRQKAIQDPIYGAILLDPWELDVISTWEMLRLRYVMQLGPAHIVYPGATHTRFQHCIGT